jgi:hypothetical protein
MDFVVLAKLAIVAIFPNIAAAGIEECVLQDVRIASMSNKSQLSGLGLKVKIVRSSGKGWVCWFGVRRVIKAEGASRCDEFALHLQQPLGTESTRNLSVRVHGSLGEHPRKNFMYTLGG